MSTISASTTSTTAYTVTADTTGALVLQTGSTPTTAMTIDTSQNVGIGTSSPSTKLHLYGATDQRIRFENTGWTKAYQIGNDQNALSFYDVTAAVERMRIDTSGNVGIGTSSPGQRLEVSNSSSNTTFSTVGNQLLVRNSGSTPNAFARVDFAGSTNNPTASIAAQIENYGTGATSIVFGSTNTGTGVIAERARIDSSGNLLVGTAAQQTGGNGRLSVAGGSGGVAATLTNNSNSSAYTTEVYNYTTSTGAGTGRYIKFAMGSTPTQTGSIIGDGTNTAFNTSSDYRLKENVEPMVGALALVMQQRPVTWVWKSNGKLGKGFIAHWLQEDGAGECVSGEKDAVDSDGNPDYQGVDTSFLVATLTAAIQEQQAIITQLQSDVAALKGQA